MASNIMSSQKVIFERYLEKQLEDPEFKEAWDALEPEYEKLEEKLRRQNKQHWTKKKYYRNIR